MVCLGSAGGSIYWYADGGTVFAMDKTTAEFSSSSLPADVVGPTTSASKFAVTTGRDGEARIVFLDAYAAGGKLNVFARRKAGSRGGDDWVLEKSVRRPSAATFGVPSAQSFSFGRSVPLSAETTTGTVKMVVSIGQVEKPAAFNLDMEKKQVKRTEDANAYPIRLPWPPSFHACTAAQE